MKRIVLFIATNLAVMLVLSIVLKLLGLDRVGVNGMDYGSLLVFSLVVGFTGAIISLFMSKPMAKWSTGARVIDTPQTAVEVWLVKTVKELSERAGIGMPEVAIFEGPPNAFATGAFKNNALIAVSTGLLHSMSEEEVRAVVGHEVAHVANGDMVTLTLIQGVVNTFVIFLARIVGSIIDRAIFKRGDDEAGSGGIGYMVTVFVCEMVFGVLASIIVSWFSRQREFRADAGSAQLLGNKQPMIQALARLGNLDTEALPQSFKSSGIAGGRGLASLFASHPPIEERIKALQAGG